MNYIFKYFVLTMLVFISMIVGEVKGVSAETIGIYGVKSNGEAFIVKNISIDVTADSAKNARDKAFREAQEKSLPILIKQLDENGYNTDMIRRAEPESIANAIKDFEILNEKISAVRYKGDFVFRYDENLLSHYFYGSEYGLPTDGYSEYQQRNMEYASQVSGNSDRILVLPFFQNEGGALVLWEGYNPWKNIWSDSSVDKVIVPIGDLSDIRDIGEHESLTYNPEKLASMAERYNVDRVVVLIGSHERSPLPTDIEQPANGVFKARLYDTARGRPNFIGDISVEEGAYKSFKEALQAGKRLSVEKIYGLASVRSIGSSEQPYEQMVSQQNIEQIPSVKHVGVTSSFQARIEYTSMQDWLRAQRKINSVVGISSIDVLSLTSEQAEIKINYSGQFDDVATDMVRKGYNLRETSKVGRYLIYSDNQSVFNKNGGIVYR